MPDIKTSSHLAGNVFKQLLKSQLKRAAEFLIITEEVALHDNCTSAFTSGVNTSHHGFIMEPLS